MTVSWIICRGCLAHANCCQLFYIISVLVLCILTETTDVMKSCSVLITLVWKQRYWRRESTQDLEEVNNASLSLGCDTQVCTVLFILVCLSHHFTFTCTYLSVVLVVLGNICDLSWFYWCQRVIRNMVKKVKFSHTRYRALGPELIPVYRQSARRWREVNHAIDPAVGCRYFLPGLRWPP